MNEDDGNSIWVIAIMFLNVKKPSRCKCREGGHYVGGKTWDKYMRQTRTSSDFEFIVVSRVFYHVTHSIVKLAIVNKQTRSKSINTKNFTASNS